ncbi:MAG TPA: ketosynthase chain-length factor [Solirubrobacteraceae bacterium]|nr:ketosynthase chain-length factor [Solirubrobacteraceae bacterium]
MSYTMTPDPSRRAVITGIGVVAPNGVGNENWWRATTAGTSGIGPITRFDAAGYPTRLAGEVAEFNVDDWIERRLQVQTDRWTHMALAATQMAFADASFDPAEFDEWSTSAITASSSGGNEFGQKEIQALWGKGPKFVGAYQSIAWFYAATTGQISIKHGLKGPCGVVIAEGAGGLEALQHARRTIRRGVDSVVSGGLEAPIGPYALACQGGNGYLSTASDPAEAYLPFDRRARGYVPGEGGAIVLVESDARAEQRGARVYAEIAGYGATHDGHHWGEPGPDARQYARAMTVALADAGVDAEAVDAVFADGFGVPEFDTLEVAAIKEALGDRARTVPVTVPKTMVGRLYAGGAPLDVAAAVLAMRDGVIPPTINLDQPADGTDMEFVTAPREAQLQTVLVLARGYGGFNAALVLSRTSQE